MKSPRTLLAVLLSVACFGAVANETAEPHTSQAVTSPLKWRMIGPFRGGRTRAVAGVPTQPNVFYIGAVDGGVWKTDDAGRTWQPIFDDQPSQSIGAIAVAPSDPDVLYVGSGEGLHRPDLSVGDGVYRSADAGRTWRHLGLPDAQQIPDLAVDPKDPNRVFAAVLGHPYGASAQRGIFRSLDGGGTWQRILFKDNDTGGSAVVIDPSRPQIVYAALWQDRLGPWEDKSQFQGTGGGLFKSTDGGDTWTPLHNGLPADSSQINISIAASRPDRLYCVVGTNEPGAYSSAAGLGVFRSDDAGGSWVRITSDPRPALRIGGGDLSVIRVDPTNPDIVYSTGLVTMKSIDGGKTWAPLRGSPGGDDYQNLWISPANPNILALVSDQGAGITLNGGKSWSSWLNQPTAQLYHVSVTPAFPYRVCAGQQESGSMCIASRGHDGEITERDWHPVGVIEYGYVAPDPLDADIIYGAGRNVVSRFHASTGQVQDVTPIPLRNGSIRVDRTEPIMFSPSDPHTLYYAANTVFKTTDGGKNWQTISPDLTREDPGAPESVGTLHGAGMEHQRGVIYSLGASGRDPGVLWAGTDDGLVWRTADGGQHWSNVTPTNLTAWSKVTQIEASHFDADSAYVSVSRMRLDDLRPYIFRTHDGGKTWSDITDGLPPDAPVNSVREDTRRQGLLFAATEKSVWMSTDEGGHWDSLQINLPHTSMRDLAVQGDDLILATHGRSVWILDDISPIRQLAGSTLKEVRLLQPSPAYRLERSTWTDTPIQPDEPLGTNPPAGALIDYFLPHDAKQKVVLEVLDGARNLVRRFTSHDVPEPSAAELERELIPRYWIAQPGVLPAQRGMHRWIWDLHYPAPITTTKGYPISAVPHSTPRGTTGPTAIPGNYIVRLSVDGHSVEAPLILKQDPRVNAPSGALQEQFRLASILAASLSASSRALLSAKSEHAQLQALLTGTGSAQAEKGAAQARAGTGAAAQAAQSFDRKLSALLTSQEVPAGESKTEARVLLPDAQGQVETLYMEVIMGDAAPTVAQTAASEEALRKVVDLMRTWQQLQTELPDLNKSLRASRLAPIRPELEPPRDLNAADED